MTDIMKLADTYADRFYLDRRYHNEESSYDRAASRAALQAAIEALQAECAEHKENAIRNARQAVAFRAERDQLQAENERLNKNNGLIYVEVLQLRNERDALQSKVNAMGKGEPIYQYQMGDGSWIDQAKHSYDYNRNHAPNAVVRIVYAAPKALAPLTYDQIDELEKNDVFLGNIYEITKEIEAAHGIGGTP